MTHKERAIAAFERRSPDFVPTFELEFQIEDEMFGQKFDRGRIAPSAMAGYSAKERETVLNEYTDHWIDIYVNKLEYSIIPTPAFLEPEIEFEAISILRKKLGDTVMIHHHGDGTLAVPDGNGMYSFAYRMADDPEGLIAQAKAMADAAIERNRRLAQAGIDCFILCDDYCYNSGPYLSPADFSVFIAPFLAKIIEAAKADGIYTVKHTDGDIMPILEQLVQCRPHAIHSLDPMAGVDIREVKRLAGDKVALCGNVNCSLLQTGTDAEIIESAKYAMDSGKPGGGYFFCTSNIPFKGIDPAKYQLVLDFWKANRAY